MFVYDPFEIPLRFSGIPGSHRKGGDDAVIANYFHRQQHSTNPQKKNALQKINITHA